MKNYSYNEEEMKILKRIYIDYKQLERRLSIDIGETTDIKKVFEYIQDLKEREKSLGFTNIELDLGYFDFNYKDMLITISNYNERKICRLAEDIIPYNDEKGYEFQDINFEDLEKLVLGYEPFGK